MWIVALHDKVEDLKLSSDVGFEVDENLQHVSANIKAPRDKIGNVLKASDHTSSFAS